MTPLVLLALLVAIAAAQQQHPTVTLTPETASVPQTETKGLVLATVRAPALAQRRPLDLMVVVDRSRSMADENKMPLVRETLRRAGDLLGDADRLGIVAFNHQVEHVLALTSIHTNAFEAIGRLEAGGNTNLAGGLTQGLEILNYQMDPEATCVLILLTDGEANVGETHGPAIIASIKARETRCTIHTFGYGTAHNYALLKEIAGTTPGGGYYHVREARDVGELFGRALGASQSVFAEEAKLVLRVLGTADIARLLGKYPGATACALEPESAHHRCDIALGPLLSGQDRQVLFEVDYRVDKLASKAQGIVFYRTRAGVGEWLESAQTDIFLVRSPEGSGDVNTTVNAQRMRVYAGEELEAAAALGHADKREEGRQRLVTLLADLFRAPSRNEPLVRALILDVEAAIDGMRDYGSWLAHGQIAVAATGTSFAEGALHGAGNVVLCSSSALAVKQAAALATDKDVEEL